jgi:3,4-dihydroxy 2-butanone 4-phosphate synthase/GTP cyclohydrolase II
MSEYGKITLSRSEKMAIAPTQEIIDEIRRGRMVVLADAEDRENEGDLVLAADFVTPEAINFMATHARGLICLTLTEERCRQLNLPLMVNDNRSPMGTTSPSRSRRPRGHDRHLGRRPRAHRARRDRAKHAKPEDIVPARPHLPDHGAERRRPRARRPHRGGLRPRRARRASRPRGRSARS